MVFCCSQTLFCKALPSVISVWELSGLLCMLFCSSSRDFNLTRLLKVSSSGILRVNFSFLSISMRREFVNLHLWQSRLSSSKISSLSGCELPSRVGFVFLSEF